MDFPVAVFTVHGFTEELALLPIGVRYAVAKSWENNELVMALAGKGRYNLVAKELEARWRGLLIWCMSITRGTRISALQPACPALSGENADQMACYARLPAAPDMLTC